MQEQSATVEPLTCTTVLTHHWLVRRRGGEKVLEALCELFPSAPIYTLVHDAFGMGADWLGAARETHTIFSSILQRVPGSRRHYPKLLPLMPAAARRVALPPVDLVMCSDAAIAKAMTADRRSLVVCYCHSPMRYVWDMADHYGEQMPSAMRPFWKMLVPRVRAADNEAAQRVDLFIANSQNVAARIKQHYGRDSVVVYPPVDVPVEPPSTSREKYYLCLGYHVSYKRLDLAVQACERMGRKLVVLGDGPEVDRLQRANHRHVSLLGWQPDEVVTDHLRRAAGLIFPGEEDFGMVPVEALARGCPVLAYGAGGALETVVPAVTGVLFERQEVDAVIDAIERFEQTTFDPHALHDIASQFGRERFLRQMREILLGELRRRRRIRA